MDRQAIFERAKELPEDYFLDKCPTKVYISEYDSGQTIIASGSKSAYELIDFWLASLAWYIDGDDFLFEKLVYQGATGKEAVIVANWEAFFRLRTIDAGETKFHFEHFRNHIPDDTIINHYEMDDTWNDYLQLIETENAFYFYRWWTGE